VTGPSCSARVGSRHSIDADGTSNMLRDRSHKGRRRVVDVAQAIVDSYVLLPPRD